MLDWYALSRVTHPFGRTFGTEHRSRTARVRGSSLSAASGWSRVFPTIHHTIPAPSNGSSFHWPSLFHNPHRTPADPPPVVPEDARNEAGALKFLVDVAPDLGRGEAVQNIGRRVPRPCS